MEEREKLVYVVRRSVKLEGLCEVMVSTKLDDLCEVMVFMKLEGLYEVRKPL